ncbi:DUF3737 family protein, partial [Candidatus Thorarchaeota archaeon]
VSIESCEAHGNEEPGLGISNSDSTIITGSAFSSQESIGVLITLSNHTAMASCNILSSGKQGVTIAGCIDTTISGLILTDSLMEGIQVVDSVSTEITGSSVFNTTSEGIQIVRSNMTVLTNNELDLMGGWGIFANYSYPVSVSDNVVANTGSHGIGLVFCNDSVIVSNEISDCLGHGVFASSAPNYTIDTNVVERCEMNGIYLIYSIDGYVAQNDVSIIAEDGISILDSPRTVITENWVNGSIGWSLQLLGSENSTVSGNTVMNAVAQLYIESCDNAVISQNNMSGTDRSTTVLETSQNLAFTENLINAPAYGGVELYGIQDSIFTDNILEECGFFIGPMSLLDCRHEFSGNIANGKPVYYSWNGSDIDLDADDWGQILLMNCTDCTITGGTMDLTPPPIQGCSTHNLVIQDAELSSKLAAYFGWSSENVTIRNCDISGDSDGMGVMAYYSNNLNFTDVRISDCTRIGNPGLWILWSSNVRLDHCIVTNSFRGIEIRSAENLTVTSCRFEDISQLGIYPLQYDNVLIEDTVVLNCSSGIWASGVEGMAVRNSTFMYNDDAAIFTSGVNQANITNNIIENNGYGFDLNGGQDIFILNNSIRWNEDYGLYIDSTVNASVYYNVFAKNLGGNGYDTEVRNWDDDVSVGNWWYPFSGSPVVVGNAQDRYPQEYLPTTPVINQPQDISYAEGSTGNTVTWYPIDDELSHWEVEIDGEYWNGNAWNFTSIIVNIDGLSYGTHTLDITVWDIHDNSVTDEVIIHVYDATPPTISSAPDREAFVDVAGQTVTWNVDDLNPDDYVLYVDDVESETGSWTTGILSVSIDDLSEGMHVLRMVIYDVDSNMAEDLVRVLVIDDDTSPIVNSPPDVVYVEDSVGNTITWIASDAYPASFEVTENDTIYVSGSWGGGRIVVNVDGLVPGIYQFRLTLIDRSGNTATDVVTVTVVTTAPETTTPGLDSDLIFLAFGTVGAVAIALALVWYLRRKR